MIFHSFFPDEDDEDEDDAAEVVGVAEDVEAGGAGVGGAVGAVMDAGVPMTEYSVPVGRAVVSLAFLLVLVAPEDEVSEVAEGSRLSRVRVRPPAPVSAGS